MLTTDGALRVSLVVLAAAAGALAAIWLVERAMALALHAAALAGAARADRHRSGWRSTSAPRSPLRCARRSHRREHPRCARRRRLTASGSAPGGSASPPTPSAAWPSSSRPCPIAQAARRRGQPAWLAVAAASALEGVGSVAYHGPGGRQAKRLHDVGLVALAVAIAMAVAREGTPVPRRPWTAALAAVGPGAAHPQPHGRPAVLVLTAPCRATPLFHVLAATALTAAAEQR